MELVVDFDKKKSVQKNFFKTDRGSKNMTIISLVLIIVGIAASAVYAIVNIFSPDLSLVRVNGEMQKDFLNIAIFTSFIFIPLVLSGFFVNRAKSNYGRRFIDNRIDESLHIDDGIVRYAFRIKYNSDANQRHVILIDLNKISNIEYNEKTEEIKILGNLEDYYYMNYTSNRPSNKTEINEFIIFDYFKPELIGALASSGIKINK